jgi:hypothetical protein
VDGHAASGAVGRVDLGVGQRLFVEVPEAEVQQQVREDPRPFGGLGVAGAVGP